MEISCEPEDYELVYAIVNDGMGSRVLQIAKQNGVTGGTILLGKGTIRNPILQKLALCDVHREIVMMVAAKKQAKDAMTAIYKELKLNKPNHGITYSIPVTGICGSSSCQCDKSKEQGEVESAMYQSVMIIVDKGKGEAVIEAAAQAGSKGATVINARGSGIHETSKLFSMEIEPEKEIVIMITSSGKTREIVDSLKSNFDIEKPGNGIIIVQNVNQAYGLIE